MSSETHLGHICTSNLVNIFARLPWRLSGFCQENYRPRQVLHNGRRAVELRGSWAGRQRRQTPIWAVCRPPLRRHDATVLPRRQKLLRVEKLRKESNATAACIASGRRGEMETRCPHGEQICIRAVQRRRLGSPMLGRHTLSPLQVVRETAINSISENIESQRNGPSFGLIYGGHCFQIAADSSALNSTCEMTP